MWLAMPPAENSGAPGRLYHTWTARPHSSRSGGSSRAQAAIGIARPYLGPAVRPGTPLTYGVMGETMGSAVSNPQGATMPTYVSLINWTEQGIKNFPDTIKRAEDFSRFVEKAGGTVHELLWTVGEYDVVHVAEFPNDEKAAAALLKLASAGNIRARTLRAFNAAEMASIIDQTGVRMEHGSWG